MRKVPPPLPCTGHHTHLQHLPHQREGGACRHSRNQRLHVLLLYLFFPFYLVVVVVVVGVVVCIIASGEPPTKQTQILTAI